MAGPSRATAMSVGLAGLPDKRFPFGRSRAGRTAGAREGAEVLGHKTSA